MTSEAAARVWANRSYRFIAWGWVAIAVGLALVLTFSPGMTWWGAIVVGMVFGAIGAIGWAVYGAPRLAIWGDRITVRNPFRVMDIPVTAVREIESGQRLTLHLRDGTVVRVWCVQAANLSLLLNRRSFVDDVAAQLRDAVSAAAVPGGAPEIIERSPASRWLGIAIVVAAVLAGVLRFVIR